jgi:hypothetical protein
MDFTEPSQFSESSMRFSSDSHRSSVSDGIENSMMVDQSSIFISPRLLTIGSMEIEIGSSMSIAHPRIDSDDLSPIRYIPPLRTLDELKEVFDGTIPDNFLNESDAEQINGSLMNYDPRSDTDNNQEVSQIDGTPSRIGPGNFSIQVNLHPGPSISGTPVRHFPVMNPHSISETSSNETTVNNLTDDKFQRLDSALLPSDCYGNSMTILNLMIDNNYLRDLNCTINERHKVIICLTCPCPLSKSNFARHLRTTHNKSNIKTADINKAFEGLDETGRIKVMAASPGATIEKVGGLSVLNGWSCNHCHHFLHLKSSCRSHVHANVSPEDQWSAVEVQSQNHGGKDVYFGVHDAMKKIVSANNTKWSAIRNGLENRRETHQTDPLISDERFQGQLERSLRWSTEIQGKDAAALMDLASLPTTSTHLSRLNSACTTLLRDINKSLRTGDRILREQLIG